MRKIEAFSRRAKAAMVSDLKLTETVHAMAAPYTSWEELKVEAERLFMSYEPRDGNGPANENFGEQTVRNAREFLDYAAKNFPVADDIDHGYWPTLCLYWFNAKPHPIDVEIFEGHFEFWRRIDLVVDVSHFNHEPGEPFPTDLAEILAAELR